LKYPYKKRLSLRKLPKSIKKLEVFEDFKLVTKNITWFVRSHF